MPVHPGRVRHRRVAAARGLWKRVGATMPTRLPTTGSGDGGTGHLSGQEDLKRTNWWKGDRRSSQRSDTPFWLAPFRPALQSWRRPRTQQARAAARREGARIIFRLRILAPSTGHLRSIRHRESILTHRVDGPEM